MADPRENEIAATMQLYFDGIYHSDVTQLARVFHDKAIYVCATESPLVYKTMPEYFALVAAREAPASRSETRTDAILSVEFAGPLPRWCVQPAPLGRSSSLIC